MKIADMNWMQVEAYLQQDDRCLLPIGCTEQHAYLSLAVDAILAERVAIEAAEPLGVPVFPVLPYGITPAFMSYPGTVTLKVDTLLRVISDLLDSLDRQGFRRILIVNGHGGNQPVAGVVAEWLASHPGCRVRLHNWWNAPRTLAFVRGQDPYAAHASWMENLPWTRLPGVAMPDGVKQPVDYRRYAVLPPGAARAMAGDGNFGGAYQRPDEDVLAMWRIAVEETRELIEGPWD